MVWYRDLDEAETLATIPADTKKLAIDAACKAAGELGIEQPRIVWFAQCDLPAKGSYSRDRAMLAETRGIEKGIWLNIAMRNRVWRELLCETIAHECKHIQQFQRGALHRLVSCNTEIDHAIAEADARSWSAAFLARYTAKPIPEEALKESPSQLLKDLRDAMATLHS